MSLRTDYAWCQPCGRQQPITARGACRACLAAARRTVRRAKANTQGAGLVRFGDLLSVADQLWSVWVRAAHDACEMCRVPFPPEALQCAHGFSRQDRLIRFDPDNTFALCAACHRRNTPARQPWFDWMRERVPADYERLERASRMRGKLRVSDLHLVILDAQQRINALPAGDRREWAFERLASIGERMTRLGVRAA